jgi:hypothetical protein
VNINLLNEFEIKFKRYDKKRTQEIQISELLNDLKSVGIKVVDNGKFTIGYGEGICLILTQLLDKYLINQNFIFKRPKYDTKVETVEEIKVENNNSKRTFSGKKFNSTMTDGLSSVSTETDYYKTNRSEVSEWRKEIDRVKNILSDSPEKLLDDKLLKVNNIETLYDRIMSNDKLITLNDNIDNELKAISRFEKIISSFDKIKDKVYNNNLAINT